MTLPVLRIANRALKVLLVEDSAADAANLVAGLVLDDNRIDLRLATTASHALRILRRAGWGLSDDLPDLVVIDLVLPDGSGREVLDFMKQDARLRHIPVTVLSVVDDAHVVRRCYDGFASAYLVKPVDPDALVALAEQLRSFWLDRALLPARDRAPDVHGTLQVLLIEDNDLDARLVAEMVRDLDALRGDGRRLRLTWAESMDEAFRLLGDRTFDAVVLDLHLGRSVGMESLEILRRRAPDVPVVVLSGTLEPEASRRSLQLGAQDFLAKDDLSGSAIARAVLHAVERRQSERLVRLSERMASIGRLVSGVAHEINNPLSSILHLSEDLLLDSRSAEDVEALELIRDEAIRSGTIIRRLLSFARGSDLQRSPVALGRLLMSTERLVANQVELLGVKLSIEFPPVDISLSIDETSIEQVLVNLILNGAQAAGAGGTVTLSSATDRGQCDLVVSDNGPGIADSILPNIFDPFFTTKAVGQGTGLGLAVSLGIAQQHGGELLAMNRPASEGTGARFTLRLPCIA